MFQVKLNVPEGPVFEIGLELGVSVAVGVHPIGKQPLPVVRVGPDLQVAVGLGRRVDRLRQPVPDPVVGPGMDLSVERSHLGVGGLGQLVQRIVLVLRQMVVQALSRDRGGHP